MRILSAGRFDQDLSQAGWVEGVVRLDTVDSLAQAVAIAIVLESSRNVAGDAGQAVSRILCKGATAVIQQVSIIIPGIVLSVNLGEAIGGVIGIDDDPARLGDPALVPGQVLDLGQGAVFAILLQGGFVFAVDQVIESAFQHGIFRIDDLVQEMGRPTFQTGSEVHPLMFGK